MPQRTSSRADARSQLPASVAEAKRVDAVLRLHSLVPFETQGFNDGVHCFFFHPTQDMQKLRRAVKECLRVNYSKFDRIGVIDHDDIASRAQSGGDGHHLWNQYINGYAFTTGLHPRPGDEYACYALAEICKCELQVHTNDAQPRIFRPIDNAARATLHLAYYCTEEWCHYRSTRPSQATPALPAGGPAPPSPGPSAVMERNTEDARIAEDAASAVMARNTVTEDARNAEDAAPGMDNADAAATSQLSSESEGVSARRSRTREYVASICCP